MSLLSDAEIEAGLAALPHWQRDGDTLVRTVVAASFLAGIELVRQVAEAAESADHHPDIDIRWRTVRFVLSTHSAGGLTALDLELAATIEGILG